jgi:hypothetical protein
MRVLAYTAVFGGHDAPKSHVAQNISVDYDYFSEADCRYLPEQVRALPDRLIAKYYKVWPYAMPKYGEYDYVVWIDGSVMLRLPDSLETLIGYCQRGYALFKHPERDCMYDEADVCMSLEKCRDQPIRQQMDAYRADGYPARHGLYECSIIVREPRSDYRRLDAAWLAEIYKWSNRDQLSFPYILWKSGIEVDVIDMNIWHNDYIHHVTHKRNT